jgi:hypothetical protein
MVVAMSKPFGLTSVPVGPAPHQVGAGLDEELGRGAADVAHALHRDAHAVEREADAPRRFTSGDEDTAAGRLDAARASRRGAAACR